LSYEVETNTLDFTIISLLHSCSTMFTEQIWEEKTAIVWSWEMIVMCNKNHLR